ncbi:MAG: vWA domain-containing protein [Planctomycetota bacterium]
MIRSLASPSALVGALALTVLATLLAAPLWPARDGREPARHAVLIDVSASVLRPRPNWLPWIRDQLDRIAEQTLETEAELLVVAYAEGTAVLFGPDSPRRLQEALRGVGERPFDPLSGELDDRASRLDEALALATRQVVSAGRRPGRVVLLGADGRGDRPIGASLARLAAAGVRLEWIGAPAGERTDVAVERVLLPRAPAVGAPLTALVTLVLGAPRDGLTLEAELRRDGDLERFTFRFDGSHPAGAVDLLLDLGTTGAGTQHLTVRHAPEAGGGDPFPENDVGRASCEAGDGRRLTVVHHAGAAGPARAFAAVLRAFPGLEVEAVEVDGLEGALERTDAFLLWDPDFTRLPVEWLDAAVREGRGLFVLGGWRALARPELPPGVELLTLEPSRDRRDDRDVVLMVDGSGSMAGETFEAVRRAAVELAAAVPPDDHLSLRWFTGILFDAVSLDVGRGADGTRRDRSEVAKRVLTSRAPQGNTALLASLEALARVRSAAPEREALVLMLTDGREEGDPIREEDRARALVRSLAASRTRLRVLLMGERVEQVAVERFVLAPEHLVRVDGETALAELLVRTALAEDLDRDPQPVSRVGGERVQQVLGTASADAQPLFTAERLVPSVGRPGADVAWTSSDGSAVLGLGTSGAGRLASLALLPSPDWSSDLWADPAPLLPVLRWLAERPGGTAPSLRLESSAGEWELVVDGLAPNAPSNLRLRLSDGTEVLAGPAAGLGRGAQRRGPWPRAAAIPPGSPVGVEVRGLEPTLVRVVDAPPAPEFLPPVPLPRLPQAQASAAEDARLRSNPAAGPVLLAAFALAFGSGTAFVWRERRAKGSADRRR